MIFLWMRFLLPQKLEEQKTIKKLHECALCAGVWIYAVLAFTLRMDILSVLNFQYVPILSEGITGGAISFVMFIWELGWKEYFTPEIHIG